MFNSIKLKTLFSHPGEGHAFLIGLFEVLCPWKPHLPLSEKSAEEMNGEYHYYRAGRAVGFPVLLFILIGIAKFILEVLL